MASPKIYEVFLEKPVQPCGWTEDDVRNFVAALGVRILEDGELPVVSTGGIQVKVLFGSDGNFGGEVAKIQGRDTVLIPGTNSKQLGIFEGPVNDSNPGPGWEVAVDLTQQRLAQGPDQSTWTIFYARRKAILNTFG